MGHIGTHCKDCKYRPLERHQVVYTSVDHITREIVEAADIRNDRNRCVSTRGIEFLGFVGARAGSVYNNEHSSGYDYFLFIFMLILLLLGAFKPLFSENKLTRSTIHSMEYVQSRPIPNLAQLIVSGLGTSVYEAAAAHLYYNIHKPAVRVPAISAFSLQPAVLPSFRNKIGGSHV